MADQGNIKQLLWRCRRGTRELDLLLGRFVENHYIDLSQDEKQAFAALLEIEDPALAQWLCLKVKPGSPGMVKIVAKILSAPVP